MINIDLKLLLRLDININEYLSIVKINAISNDSDIPFITDSNNLDTLEKKGYIESKGQDILLTSKAIRHFKLNCLVEDITEIIEYFKTVTDKNKISTESISNRKYIKDRLQQGYTKDDLKQVIDIKYKEWKDDKIMKQYIRIETLFNQEKFQKYIGQIGFEEEKDHISSNMNVKRI